MKIFAAILVLGSTFVGVAATACGGTSDPNDGSAGGKGGDDGGATGGTSAGGSGTSGDGGGGSGTGGNAAASGSGGSNPSGGAGGGGAAGGGGSGDCAVVCQEIVAANCPNEGNQTVCLGDCAPLEQQCPTELSALAACVAQSGTVSCGSDGNADINGCNDSVIPLARCAACLPDSNDTECDTCQKTNCCNELERLIDAPNVLDFVDCLNACTNNPSCVGSCQSQYPEAGSAYTNSFQCAQSSCPNVC